MDLASKLATAMPAPPELEAWPWRPLELEAWPWRPLELEAGPEGEARPKWIFVFNFVIVLGSRPMELWITRFFCWPQVGHEQALVRGFLFDCGILGCVLWVKGRPYLGMERTGTRSRTTSRAKLRPQAKLRARVERPWQSQALKPNSISKLAAMAVASFKLSQPWRLQGSKPNLISKLPAAMAGSYDEAPGGPGGNGQRPTSSGQAMARLKMMNNN
ncbi:hypothetical protein NL676_006599 [Syzygium grande]|nr:hypothetical protein NL676_006599 [Syzygium grande]